MNKYKVTIFTPTYNRKNRILSLYNSLCLQKNYSFEWLIVDDGSTDGTQEKINELCKESQFLISYYFQENQGKHIAFNRAIKEAKGDLFICVDSDDCLTDNAINIFLHDMSNLEANIIGVAYKRQYSNKDINYIWEQVDGKLIDVMDLKEQFGIVESAVLFRTSVLQNYSFPVIKNEQGIQEKFCSESVLYNLIAKEGKFIAFNKLVYIGNYVEDGLTKNLFNKTWMNSPYSVIYDMKSRYQFANKYGFALKYLLKIKALMNLNAICLVKNISIWNKTPSVFGSLLLLIPSYFFMLKRFK